MFDLFKSKKKPISAIDAFIFAVYGNPPPTKSAKPDEAAQLAHQELLLEIVAKDDIDKLTAELNAGPIPYSTHDLALSVALNFLRREELVPSLAEAQLFARMKALEWLKEHKVAPPLVGTFEETLYKLYKAAI